MRHIGLIPRHRLQNIPLELRARHEFCFFLHDECVRMLKEYENERVHFVTVKFPSNLVRRNSKK
jgi:hypothetical protein